VEAASWVLCQWAACLLWCPICGRLVTAGRHGSDWRRQWWANDIGLGLATNIWHMEILRELCVAATAAPHAIPQEEAAAGPAPPAARPYGLKELPAAVPPRPPPPDDSGDWEWVPDEGDADAVGQAQAEGGPGEH
jgi:hypothetical protein